MASSEALRDYYIDQIRQNGYAQADFSVSRGDMLCLFDSFEEVIFDVFDSPGPQGQHIINALSVEHHGRPLDSKGFIEQRRVGRVSIYEIGRDPSTDDKDQMHVTPLTYGHAEDYFRGQGGMPRVLRNLLDQCVDLQAAIHKSIIPVADALGVKDYLFAPHGMESNNVHMLRLLRYLGNKKTSEHVAIQPVKPLAGYHFDRSKFTVAGILESRSGLRGAQGNNAVGDPNLTVEEFEANAERALYTPLPYKAGKVKLFAGAGYNHLPLTIRKTSGNLPLLGHLVEDDEPGEERLAAVNFLNQHTGIKELGTPLANETGYDSVRAVIAERQERYGGMVA